MLERIEEGLGERKQEHAESVALEEGVSPSIFMRSISSAFEMIGTGPVSVESPLGVCEETKEEKPTMRALSTPVKQPGMSERGGEKITMANIFFGTKIDSLKLLKDSENDISDVSPISPFINLSR